MEDIKVISKNSNKGIQFKFGNISVVLSVIGIILEGTYIFVCNQLYANNVKSTIIYMNEMTIFSNMMIITYIVGVLMGLIGLIRKNSRKVLCIIGVSTNLILLALLYWDFFLGLFFSLKNIL